jgi:hypothetical protein
MWTLGNLLSGQFNQAWKTHLYITGTAGLVCFLLSWLIFDRCCSHAGESAPVIRKSRNGRPRRWARVTRAWSRLPLAWKDFHFMIGGRFGIYLRLFVAAVIFCIGWWAVSRLYRTSTYYRHAWEEIAAILMFTAGCCAALEILLLAGRIFGSERRRLTLSSLVGLPWTTGKIIRQKVLGCLPVLLPWILLAFAGFWMVRDPLLRELARELDSAEWEWRRNREEIAATCYVGLQAVLALVLVAWLSLRLRRGALPAAAAILTVWNIVFAICVDEVHSRDEYLALSVGAFLSAPVVVLMMRAVYRRIQLAAAED